MWDKPLKELEKVDNPTETDETEDEKNELLSFVNLPFYLFLVVKIKTWELELRLGKVRLGFTLFFAIFEQSVR